MKIPFMNLTIGTPAMIGGVIHTFMWRDEAGDIFRSEVNGRTVTYSTKELASLYFEGNFEVPRQAHPRARSCEG